MQTETTTMDIWAVGNGPEGADYIGLEEITDRVEALEALSLVEPEPDREDADAERTWELIEELKRLNELLDDLRGNGSDHEWRGAWYPQCLIREDHFEDYARELAEDIGAIPNDAAWPCPCIDWAEAAAQLQQDYSDVNLHGVDYLYR